LDQPLNALLIAAFKVGINIELARVYAAVDSGHNCVPAHVDRQTEKDNSTHRTYICTYTFTYTYFGRETFDSLKFDTPVVSV